MLMGPAMLNGAPTVIVAVLLTLPNINPVRVFAKLYTLLLKALENALPLVGSIVNAPTPVKPEVVGRVLFWKTKRPAATVVLPT
jgi:hypothetical protein